MCVFLTLHCSQCIRSRRNQWSTEIPDFYDVWFPDPSLFKSTSPTIRKSCGPTWCSLTISRGIGQYCDCIGVLSFLSYFNLPASVKKSKTLEAIMFCPRMEMLSTLPCTVQKPMVRLWCQVSPARIRGNPDLQRELGCFSIVLTWLKCYSDVWSKCILSASTLHTFSS